MKPTIQQLLQTAIDKNASDLHIISPYLASIRINNRLLFLRDFGPIQPEVAEEMILSLLSPEQKTFFLENKEIDIGYDFAGTRFRVNIYINRKSVSAAFRLIPNNIKTVEELNLPDIFHTFATYNQGLILFTGPTGEGKSSSLAAIINEINLRHSKHIITIEDPIEYVYPIEKSIISQREVHQDTLSFNIALKSVLREDPDIVLVGEMRDYETVQSTLRIAETGHLVFSTLHTGSTKDSIDRIIDMFPSHQQNQIRSTLSQELIAIVAQRLLPNSGNTDRIPAVEILLNTSSVASVIRDGKTFMIDTILETGEEAGMVLFERYLYKLYQQGLISRESAIGHAIRPNIISKLIK